MLEKNIQKQKLKIKKRDTGKIENLANFKSSDIFVFFQYKMSLKFGEIELNENEFHRSKQRIYLNQVEIKKLTSSLVLNLIVNMFMMKNTLKLEKESYPRVDLEQCKLRLKKRKALTYLMINQKIETE